MLQWAKYRLAECEREGGCSAQDLEFYRDRIAFFEGLDRFTDEALRAACDADPTGGTCRAYVADALCAAGARSTAACGGVPGFGTQRWGYHKPETMQNAEMYDRGRRYMPRFTTDRGNRDEYESIQALLAEYPDAVEAVRGYDSIGAAIDMGLGGLAAGAAGVRGATRGRVGDVNQYGLSGTYGQRQYQLSLGGGGTLGAASNNGGTPIREYPDGSFRTPDGKFASQGGLPSPGTKSAQEYTQYLRDSGFDVVGEELTVSAAVSTRRYDAVIRTDSGELWGIECKSGGGSKTSQQNFNDMYMNRFGPAEGVGQIAGEKL
ncbi:hypothetical protein [Halovulum sp. GXIMD14793]